MSFHVVIPARYGSTRLPGKPLLEMQGRPLVQYVYEQACKSGAASITIATDDERIAKAAQKFGADVCMTKADHQSGTDRLAEVVEKLKWPDDALVVNVQGDEPLIPPANITQVAEDLAAHPDASMATLYQTITQAEDILNPNIVKVVLDAAGYALYFSRAAIPWQKQALQPYFRHIGLYAYRAGFIKQYSSWPRCELEQSESLEQLRVLWQGARIHLTQAGVYTPPDVNTLDDFEQVSNLIRESANAKAHK